MYADVISELAIVRDAVLAFTHSHFLLLMHHLLSSFCVLFTIKIFIAMQPVKVEIIQDNYTTLQNTK